MESVDPERIKLKIVWAVYSKVVSIKERFMNQHVSGFGDNAIFNIISLGWYVHFEGSYESLNFGNERPPFKEGDTIRISFEKLDV